MDRCLSSVLFTASFSGDATRTRESYELTDAQKVGFKEKWLQEAISENPELVLAPCRAAGIIPQEEHWEALGSEVPIGAGNIDLLLVSEFGRVAIVETKLAYNREARREVVAQVLEYAIHLQSCSVSQVTKAVGGPPLVHEDDVQARLSQGDYLLIIAGDQLDPRAIKLSQDLLSRHLVHPWELALVEVAVFRRGPESGREYLLVPHVRGVLVTERRHVVTVVDSKGSTVQVTAAPATPVAISRPPKWNEQQFFVAVEHGADELRDFTGKLQTLRKEHPEVSFEFGASKDGSLLLKKDGASLLGFYLGHGGSLSFRTKNDTGEDNFVKAFGEQWGLHYRRGLEKLVNRSMESGLWFGFPFQADKAKELLRLLTESLNGSRADQRPSETAPAA